MEFITKKESDLQSLAKINVRGVLGCIRVFTLFDNKNYSTFPIVVIKFLSPHKCKTTRIICDIIIIHITFY